MGKKKSGTKVERAESMVVFLRENLENIKDKKINKAFVDDLDACIKEYLILFDDVRETKELLKSKRSELNEKTYEIKDLMDSAKKFVKKELAGKKTKAKKNSKKPKPKQVK